MELHSLTMVEAADGLAQKTFSSREIVASCLKAAKDFGPRTRAYSQITEAIALMGADASDARRAADALLSPLDGVPIALKDNMLWTGARATAASDILREYVAPYDSTVAVKLKSAGMVLVGKTNMDEFAMGSSTESSCFGPTGNPWNAGKIPGGSSGGSAAAVAEHSTIAALGSDTGGSIRQPAAMCGVVGLKPTYGRVSRYGLIAMASSLDQIGPLTKTVADSAMLLRTIEGRDPMDSTSVDIPQGNEIPESFVASGDRPLRGLRVGVPKEYFAEGLDAAVGVQVRAAIERLAELGAELKEVSLPHTEYALAAYYVIMPSEVSSNLARFDGIRYGRRESGATLEETYRASRGKGFGKEVRRRIMLGTYALSAGYYDAYYLKALKMRRLISNDFAKAFSEVDLLATPTSPVVAWKIGEKSEDPLAMYLEDAYTVSVNVAGLPAISVPCGLAGGMPVGLQLIGKHFDEKTILSAAHAYELAADFRTHHQPSLS